MNATWVVAWMAAGALCTAPALAGDETAASARASASASASAGSDEATARTREVEQARAELDRAKAELQRAAAEMARAYSESALKSPKAEAYRYFADTNRGFLGVNIEEGPDLDGEIRGALITGITPGSGADKAGLKSGDLLLAANGHSLVVKDVKGASPTRKLMEVMSSTRVGADVRCDYERAGRKKSVTVTAGRPPAEDVAMWHDEDTDDADDDDVVMFRSPSPPTPVFPPGMYAGMQLAKLDGELATYFKTGDGVLVVKAGDANELGIKGGDVIQEIAGERVDSPVEMMQQLSEATPGSAVSMKIVRQGRTELLKGTAPDPSARVVRAPPVRPVRPVPPAPPAPP